MKPFIALLVLAAALGSVSAQEPAPVVSYRTVDGVPSRGFQGDPADSVYRVAHDLLARGEYGRSAQLFKEIGEKYPKSRYGDELPYNEAFARYRIGTTRELEAASRLLEPRAKKLLGTVTASNTPSEQGRFGKAREGDVVGLYIRVNQALAQRGNSDAANIVRSIVTPNPTSCDATDRELAAEAIGALSNMDPSQALPILKHVLDKRDECNVSLRKNAVFMLGRIGNPEATSTLASTAKNDPAPTVRVDAIGWLPRLMGDAGVAMLEEVLRTEQDQRVQRAAVRTIASSSNPRAKMALRALLDRRDVLLDLRVDAVRSISGDRASSDDAAYLRQLFSRADNDQLKEAILGAVSRTGGRETDEWILAIAKNQNESSSVRSQAISLVMRSGTVADWTSLYDAAQSFDLRRQLVTALENRKETEAADKLVDIAKTSTVPPIRLQALRALLRRKDPRAPQLVAEIMNGKP